MRDFNEAKDTAEAGNLLDISTADLFFTGAYYFRTTSFTTLQINVKWFLQKRETYNSVKCLFVAADS